MEQSISFKIGKGSIAHNARDFTASNVDSNRSQYNEANIILNMLIKI